MTQIWGFQAGEQQFVMMLFKTNLLENYPVATNPTVQTRIWRTKRNDTFANRAFVALMTNTIKPTIIFTLTVPIISARLHVFNTTINFDLAMVAFRVVHTFT